MAMNEDLQKGDKLIIFHPEFGFVRAVALEDKKDSPGDSAVFEVRINSENMPGVESMTINVNHWDAYKADDLRVLKRIRDHYVKAWQTR